MIGVGSKLVKWEQFKENFYDKYFFANLIRLKEKEVLSLEQDNMSVEKYDQKFEQLSHFAPTMVATKAERMKRFVQGLRDGLQGLVQAFKSATQAEDLCVASQIDTQSEVKQLKSLGVGSSIGHKRKAN